MGHHASASLNYGYCFNKYDDDYDKLPWEIIEEVIDDWYYFIYK